MSVIVSVIVGRRPPSPYLAAWVVADYLEEKMEERVSLSIVRPLPPLVERLIGVLYEMGDAHLTEAVYLETVERLRRSFVYVERQEQEIINHTHFRFWLDK